MKYNPLGGKFRKSILRRVPRKGQFVGPTTASSFEEFEDRKSKLAQRFHSDARKFSGVMFAHSPLTEITAPEKKVLKAFAQLTLKQYGRQIHENTYFGDALRDALHKEKINTIQDPRRRAQAYMREGIQGSNPLLSAYGPKIVEKADALIKKFGEINALDVGAGQGDSIRDLQSRYGPKIRTHSISYEDEPTGAKVAHVLEAAFLPKKFRNRFHLITSNMAFRYMALPGYSLENCLRALRPGGYATITIGSNEMDRFLPYPAGLTAFLHSKLKKTYPKEFFEQALKNSPRALNALVNASGFSANNMLALINEGKKAFYRGEKVNSQIGYGGNYKLMGFLAMIFRTTELFEEIERLKFLHTAGAIQLELSKSQVGGLPHSVEFMKMREPTSAEEAKWQERIMTSRKMNLKQFLLAIQNGFHPSAKLELR